MIDLHCHLLPGLDDGAKDMADAVQMAKQAYEQGITTVVVTPHYYPGIVAPSTEVIKSAKEALQDELKVRGINLRLVVGQEIFLGPEVPELIHIGKLITIGELGRYVLLELPMLDVPYATQSVFFQLLATGITPILAHPERNEVLQKQPNLLYEWVSKGVLVQMNTGSLTGLYGKRVARCAKTLVKHQLVHFLGSDAHSSRVRPPIITEAVAYVEAIGGKTLVNKLLIENPSCVIAGKKLSIEAPRRVDTQGNLLRRVRNWLKSR